LEDLRSTHVLSLGRIAKAITILISEADDHYALINISVAVIVYTVSHLRVSAGGIDIPIPVRIAVTEGCSIAIFIMIGCVAHFGIAKISIGVAIVTICQMVNTITVLIYACRLGSSLSGLDRHDHDSPVDIGCRSHLSAAGQQGRPG
jgi:hypothetical protein